MTDRRRVALVTGASSGIGEAAALALRERGFTVYAGARRVERMAPLARRGVRVLALDVADDASARAAVARVLDDTGRIDLLVNNAGCGVYGAVEDVPLEEGRRQFEVNFFGLVRLVRLVLPPMRRQGSGRIVNVSSVGGRIHTPFAAWYHGSKFAVEGFSDVLRGEVRPFGVDVVVIQPGGVRTEWADLAAQQLRSGARDGPYATRAAATADAFTSRALAARLSPPSLVAAAVAEAATARRPRARYAVGHGARPALLLRRLLPDRAFDAFVRRLFPG